MGPGSISLRRSPRARLSGSIKGNRLSMGTKGWTKCPHLPHWYKHPHTPVGKLAGGPPRPHKANLINRTGGADGFLFATFSFGQDWQAAGPLGYAFLGCTFYVAHWEQIPVLRLRAPLCTRSSMTPYSLIGREAAAARTHDLATSVGLLVFTSNLNGHGRKRS